MADVLRCKECGAPMVTNPDGTTSHLILGPPGLARIDHERDRDHAATAPFPPPDDDEE